jgi:hypothetical protein
MLVRLALMAIVCFSSVVVSKGQEVVDPSSILSARAYLCNSHNQDVASTYSVDNTPLQIGAMLRVCVEVVNNVNTNNVSTTTSSTFHDEDLFLLKIVDFAFVREWEEDSHQSVDPALEDNVFISRNNNNNHSSHAQQEQQHSSGNVTKVQQQVLENGVATDPGTTSLICSPGSRICVFQILALNEVFFLSDGIVEGIGSVALQYGDGRDGDRRGRQSRGRNRYLLRKGLSAVDDDDDDDDDDDADDVANNFDDDTVIVPINIVRTSSSRRDLQDFAGVAALSMKFSVTDGTDGTGILPALEVDSDGTDGRSAFTAQEYWTESERWIQGLIIGVVLIILVIVLCLCGGLWFFGGFCGDYSYDRKREAESNCQQIRARDSRNAASVSFYSDDIVSSRGHPFEGLPVLMQWSSEQNQKSRTGNNTQKALVEQSHNKRKSYLDEEDLSETHSIDDDEEWGNDDHCGYQKCSVAASLREQDLPASGEKVKSTRPSPQRSRSRGGSTEASSPVRTISRKAPMQQSPPQRTSSGVESIRPELSHPSSPVRAKSSRESFRPSPVQTKSRGESRQLSSSGRSERGVDPIRPSHVRTNSGMSTSGGDRRVNVDGTGIASFSSMATTKCSNKITKGKSPTEKKETISRVSIPASCKKDKKRRQSKATKQTSASL